MLNVQQSGCGTARFLVTDDSCDYRKSQQYFAGTEVKNDEKHYAGHAEKRKECGQMRLGVLANSYLDFSVMSRMNYL